MKNFDDERSLRPRRPPEARTFVLGGETFVAVDRFRPEVLTYLEELPTEKTDPTTCVCTHRLHNHAGGACDDPGCDCVKMRPVVTQEGATLAQQLAALDRTILEMIEPGDDAEERYRTLRGRKADPIEITDLMAVATWATAGDVGRPTGGPGVSTPGPESTGTTSTEDSSSPEAQAA